MNTFTIFSLAVFDTAMVMYDLTILAQGLMR